MQQKNHAYLGSSAGNEGIPRQKNMPFLLYWQETKSFTIPLLPNYAPLNHWQVKKPCPVLHLPKHGA